MQKAQSSVTEAATNGAHQATEYPGSVRQSLVISQALAGARGVDRADAERRPAVGCGPDRSR